LRLLAPSILAIITVVSVACSSAPAAPSQPPAATTSAQSASPISTPAATVAASAFPLTIKDDSGREVTIPKAPQRIISLSSSNTEILFALGLENRIVGVDEYSNYPPAAKSKPTVGGFANPDLEKIVALEPDLILGTSIHVKVTLPELDRHGLRTVIIDPKNVGGVLDGIRLVAKITGQQREADAVIAGMQTRIDSVQAAVKGTTPVRVFYEISPQLHTAGPGTFVNDVLQMAVGANVAASAGDAWPQMNQESLLLADPEVILIADQPADVTPDMVAARPGWSQVSAVKNKRILVVNDDLTSRPGPRVADGVEFVAKALHPDRVK
jgi:iron complex transport system substrate-binding protein